MIEIIKVERKRILSNGLFLIIIAVILIYSLITGLLLLKNYTVYDQQGNILMTAKENLRESKKPQHNVLLNEETIKNVVLSTDTSRYLYNSNLVKLVASNYNKKIADLTDKNISDFYKQRLANVKLNIRGYPEEEGFKALIAHSEQLKTPITVGYAEGWKSLNNGLVDFCTVMVFGVPFIILFIFGKNPKVKMEELCASTKQGKKPLIKGKIATAFILGSAIYFIGIVIFTASRLCILGFQGGNLPIQGSIFYLFSPYNLTFFQQYLINVIAGFMALMLMTSLTVLITVLLKQLMSSAIVLTLFLVIMTMLPNNNPYLNYYLRNFLPYGMTNFGNFYFRPHTYNIFGGVSPAFTMVSAVALILCILFIAVAYILCNRNFRVKG